MRSRSACVKRRRSAVLDRYCAVARWRSRCWLAPRAARVAEEHRHPDVSGEPSVLSHLLALVPGQRATQPFREPTHGRGQRRANLLGPPASRQGHQHHRSAGPFDQVSTAEGTCPAPGRLPRVPGPCAHLPRRAAGGSRWYPGAGLSPGQALAPRVAHRPAGAQTAAPVTVEDPRCGTYKLR